MDSFHRFLPSVLVVSTLVVSAALADRMPVNQAAIDGVKSGELNTATASWWGFDPEDSTEALRSAINSGAKKLTVDNMGSPWIVEPMQLASNQEILFQKGGVVQAKRGSFKGTGDCLFTAAVKENITLSGYGATLRMWKEDYHTDAYQKAEWRHTLSVRSSKNVKVLGLTLANSGGDGIYLGVSQKGVTNKGVHIKDVVCADHNRQGISVITAEDLLIEDTILKDTRGTAPQAGIDFEPNDPSERLVNCVMRNCVSENNAGDAYDFYIPTLHASSAPVSIRLENCRSVGGMRAVSITTGNDPRTAVNGKIEFVNCRFEGSEHAGIVVNRKPATGCEVQFANCVVADAALKQPMQTPILLGNAANDTEDIGGVEFADLVVVDPVDRNPMSYLDLAGGLALVDVTGSVSVERDGKRSTYTIDQKLIDQWMPHRTCKRFPRFVTEGVRFEPAFPDANRESFGGKSLARQRVHSEYLLWAEKGKDAEFAVVVEPVGRNAVAPVPIVLVSPSGKEIPLSKTGIGSETPYAFTPEETGAYKVVLDPGSNTTRVYSISHRVCEYSDSGSIHFLSTAGQFFFWVPAGVKEFGVKVSGDNVAERVKASLLDPTGKLLEEQDSIAQTHQFVVERRDASVGEGWSIKLERPSQGVLEDYHVQLQGVAQVLSSTKEGLLKPGK